MTKVSIVGVEGSGKTVLLAALGDKYQLPDKDGMFFRARDVETFAFVQKQMGELRAGRWPVGTQADRMQHVNWRLMRRREGAAPVSVGEVTMLDFAGEVYTAAFGGAEDAERGDVSDEVEQLRNYVATSDRLVVLVNIADLCNGPDATDPKVLETLWASMGILDFAEGKGVKRVAIGLSQYERFRALAEECGGPLETLRKYAPFLYAAYGHLPLFTLTAVDKIVSDARGLSVPAPGFASQGLDTLMSWVLDGGRGATALPDAPQGEGLYRIVDLKTGGITHLDAVPSGGWTDEYKTSKLVLRRIEPGAFTMGSPANEEGRYDSETQHRVTLTKPFYIGVFQVTQGQWESVMGGTILDQARKALQDDTLYELGGKKQTLRDHWGLQRDSDPTARCGDVKDDLPMYNVCWSDCVRFCGNVSSSVGKSFRLPTEAEWEYACRAGSQTAVPGVSYFSIVGENNAPALDGIAWYGGNSSEGFNGSGWKTADWKEKQYPGGTAGPRIVGMKKPNVWGLYDMIGNVWEWCSDWFGWYNGDATDPAGPTSGSNRVYRGGSWRSLARSCRSAYRYGDSPGCRYIDLGFRLCCSAGPLE